MRLESEGRCKVDTLGIEPRASRMLSGCDTTTPRALCSGERKDANGATVACRLLSPGLLSSNFKRAKGWRCQRVYGATVARLTPDQKVGSSNLSALISEPCVPEALQFKDNNQYPNKSILHLRIVK